MTWCPVERRQVIWHGTFDNPRESSEVVVGPCNTPLFGAHRARGICRSCASGWETDGNRPTARGREQIAERTR